MLTATTKRVLAKVARRLRHEKPLSFVWLKPVEFIDGGVQGWFDRMIIEMLRLNWSPEIFPAGKCVDGETTGAEVCPVN